MAKYKDPENTLILDTTKGEVVIELLPELAPKHVERIKELASDGFYDGVIFHRVIDGFMAQGGDPTGTGMGGSKKPDLPAEFSREPHIRGVCSMARSQNPNSANSQFFICLDDATFLDGQYTVWGRVLEGMENVDKFAKGEPVRNPDSMTTARLASAPAKAEAKKDEKKKPAKKATAKSDKKPAKKDADKKPKTATKKKTDTKAKAKSKTAAKKTEKKD